MLIFVQFWSSFKNFLLVFSENLKFGFSEKATKVRNSGTCQKVDEDFSKQMWSSRIIQTLTWLVDSNSAIWVVPV